MGYSAYWQLHQPLRTIKFWMTSAPGIRVVFISNCFPLTTLYMPRTLIVLDMLGLVVEMGSVMKPHASASIILEIAHTWLFKVHSYLPTLQVLLGVSWESGHKRNGNYGNSTQKWLFPGRTRMFLGGGVKSSQVVVLYLGTLFWHCVLVILLALLFIKGTRLTLCMGALRIYGTCMEMGSILVSGDYIEQLNSGAYKVCSISSLDDESS